MNKFLIVMTGFLLMGGCASEKKPSTPKVVSTPVAKATMAPSTPIPSPTATPEQKVEVPAPSAPVDPAVDSPTVVIQKYTEELKTMVEPNKPKDKTKRDAAKEKRIAEKVRQFFDFEGLARMALGRHWTKITTAQRTEYSDLFITLIEDSYLRRTADIVGDYKIVYTGEEIKGNFSKVTSSVARDDADVDIVYELHRNPKNWMIFNIRLDNVDLIRNYQTQFNRIIEQNGISDLLSKMRKKKDDLGKEPTL